MTTINTNILTPQEQDDDLLQRNISAPVPKLSTPAPVLGAEPEGMRRFGDVGATRQAIYANTMAALSEMEPTVGKTHTLRMTSPKWADPEMYSKARHKQALLAGESLGRRIKATWELINNETGEVVDTRNQVVARAPYLTHNGTFVHNGNEYAIKNQQRLRPGLFTRVKNNGEIETHANVLDGGPSHRYFLDPEKGVFYVRAGQAKIPLLPLLRELGAQDDELRNAWGRDIFATNYGKMDASHVAKLKAKFAPREGQTLKGVFEGMTLDPEVTQRTMGAPYDKLDKEALIATTKKLLNVSKGESEPDDRDHLAYQTFLGPEDLIAERLRRDRAGVRRQLLYKAVGRGNLGAMPSSALQGQVDSTILESGLGQSLEEINPAEIFDKQTQISRLGEGGIPSLDAIPDEARAVQPSHMGFMDPLRTPESFRVGVDVHMARNARKGRDGKIYSQFKTRKGEMVWKTPQEAADLVVGFPGSAKSKDPMVPAMHNGRITYVKKNAVDLELPHFENAFSSLGNLVPIKSMVKGQRVAMASRMLTQALPLQGAEAPLVQGAVPGSDTSFEREYGTKMGALRASGGGKVVDVTDDTIKVQYDNGKTEDIELYHNQPFNRKTFVHQTATVQPGQRFNSGDLLARSNFTDGVGETALGLNARVAYVPWKGSNFEDAIVISEGMAKRLTSEHMYQHDLELSDKHKTGKAAFVGLFPSKYDKKTLANFDDKGLIKPGTEVSYGDPLILAAQEKSTAANKVHRKGKAAFNDASVTWKHHDPGVVTDVVSGKNGPVVLVKSKHPMQVGDKMSGRYGDKGVVSSIIPDNQMPHDAQGQPYEVLLNPLGVISRTNPAQMVEAALGKIARRNGRPIAVKDFDDVEDMTAWAKEQLAKAGLSDLEDIVDPSTERKITGIATGERFFMKLHHTAESKGQGRGSGGYSADDSPAKGGASGCLLGHHEVLTEYGSIPIEEMVRSTYDQRVATVDSEGDPALATVTNWFEYLVPTSDLIEVELEDGRVLTLTRNHDIVLPDGTKVPAGELKPGDEISCHDRIDVGLPADAASG